MPKTVILGAARTPIGKMGGGLSTIDATELGATAITAALERAYVAPDEVQHVVMRGGSEDVHRRCLNLVVLQGEGTCWS